MYTNFRIKSQGGHLAGYHWPVESPTHVMCIIHGIGEYCGRYDRMAGILNDAGIAVVGMDLMGHGISEGKRGHTAPREKVLQDVSSMIDEAQALYPDIPLILYGHSMGGNICLDYRSRGEKNHVPAKYIVSGPWLRLVKEIPTPIYKGVKGIAKYFPAIQMSSGCEAKDLGNIEITRPYDSDPLVHASITISTAADCIGVARALLAGVDPDNGGATGKPFLLMHGSADKICSVEGSRDLAKRYKADPLFTYVEWEGYYHEIHNGGPEATGEEVIYTIRDFIKEK